MKNLSTLVALLTLALTLALPAAAAKKDKGPASFRKGMLADAKGMTLYTFDMDKAAAGKSACNGPCAKNWPPLTAPAKAQAAGDWSIVTRDDGSTQWAYKGQPVYLWTQDKKAGDMTGDGFKDVWHVVKEPAAAK